MTSHSSQQAPSGYFLGKTAVITGAGGTLCSALALGLAREGARVALLGRTLAGLETVADRITADGGAALPVACDVTDIDAVERARVAVAEALGPVDFLVNGAGGNQTDAITTSVAFTPGEILPRTDPARPPDLRGFFDLDLSRFEDVVRINTLGTVIPSQVFGREMAARRSGAILNFASMNSTRPLTRVAAYAMAKAGIVNFTQWLAVYLAPANIRVNAVAPGFFLNDKNRRILLDPAADDGLSARGRNVIHHTPAARFGAPDELLGAVLWLLDDRHASFVSGQTIAIDGGFLAHSGI